MNFPRESLDGWRWQGSMRARCLSYYFTESEPTVGREKLMDASNYRIAGDAHRTVDPLVAGAEVEGSFS
ncbi:hypothetical protein QYF36_021711 [Acer negundo]|nr:hypothetical protein QYF36_021711 [Acer negundo]